jgi:hypothetical protein
MYLHFALERESIGDHCRDRFLDFSASDGHLGVPLTLLYKREGGLVVLPPLVDMPLFISGWSRYTRVLPIRAHNGSLSNGLVWSALLRSAKAGSHPVVQGEW